MDAVEFFKERRRMCLNYNECKGCPCEKSDPVSCDPSISEIEILVKIIEQWSQSHPQKTMMQDSLRSFLMLLKLKMECQECALKIVVIKNLMSIVMISNLVV